MFEKHVKLIMKQDSLKESDAKMRAWLEGEKGYETRLTVDAAKK